MLDNLHSIISGTVEDSQNRYTALLSSLTEHLNIVESNQRELNSQDEEPVPESQPFFETEADEEDYDED